MFSDYLIEISNLRMSYLLKRDMFVLQTLVLVKKVLIKQIRELSPSVVLQSILLQRFSIGVVMDKLLIGGLLVLCYMRC